MGKHIIDAQDADSLSKQIVNKLVDLIDENEFRDACDLVKRREFPLRYHTERYLHPKSNPNEKWVDPTSPFGYETVSHRGDNSLCGSEIYIDVMGYHRRNAVINNIIITEVDAFGLDENDPLAEIVRDLVEKQNKQFLERLERHQDKLRGLRAHYGTFDPRYKKLLREEPKRNNVMDIARNEITSIFESVEFMKYRFELIGINLENRTMRFGIDLGRGGKKKKSRYFGILEIGKNPRWMNKSCMIFSMYAKSPGAMRVLHPYKLHRGDYRTGFGPSNFECFLSRAMLSLNEMQEFFGRHSTGVQAYYKKTFPFSAVPVRLVRP